jgi:hypothetical protein
MLDSVFPNSFPLLLYPRDGDSSLQLIVLLRCPVAFSFPQDPQMAQDFAKSKRKELNFNQIKSLDPTINGSP